MIAIVCLVLVCVVGTVGLAMGGLGDEFGPP